MFGFMFAIGTLELRILTIKKRKRRNEGRKDGRKQRKDGGWGLGQVLIPILLLPTCGHGWWLHLLELPLPRLSHSRTVLTPLHRGGCEDMMCRHAQSEGPLPLPSSSSKSDTQSGTCTRRRRGCDDGLGHLVTESSPGTWVRGCHSKCSRAYNKASLARGGCW